MSQAEIARIHIDTRRVISPISPLLFSGFAEHMGRCIYEGIYDPSSPHADENGLRRDVLAALRELNFRSMRYPGGNFLSGYHWEDGIGPKAQRPHRRDLAWQSIEINQFGTDEFLHFCREIGTEPMLGVNMGTGSIQDAANLVEYCNAPSGSQYADLRATNGNPEPYGVKYWCLGNEMDGPWQIGHLNAIDYGKKAREAAKMMRWHDDTISLVLCGSSGPAMPSYPEWDRVALELCWEAVDYHSMHYYATNIEDDSRSFLALSAHLEEFVDALAGTLRYVKAKTRSKRDVYLSWDEWNVWYKARELADMRGGWTEAPHLIEEVYNLEDALVVAQWLSVFLRKADVLKIACLAQIVNVIAPLLTRRDALLKQSIYYPLLHFSRLAKGDSLDVLVESPQYETAQFGDMPLLDASSGYDAETGSNAIFLVNRSLSDELPLEIDWQGRAPQGIIAAHQLAGSDPKAHNSWEAPNTVMTRPIPVPQVVDGAAQLSLPPLSFTALEVAL
ncbi:MAG: alpha-N-arabinofuranosidase [Chloroflexi bacterium]|nr:alpha-N-arabinofuranosidase [Chloroflexota bacterium]MCY3583194.1 alpha-N-arabinofuranosidase [Chloroflexota bacterium]MCY3715969.1 alpha-N-arabinofuranosidase [Chloroflexota bacterium]MDE2651540.1 alpha-N-arabinofuranosidase [Chloroflexota bacterium]